jgi:hypothetical protein
MHYHDTRAPSRFFLRAILRGPQYFFLMMALAATAAHGAELRAGNNYPLTFTDVDRHQLSTSDGHVTIITVLTKRDEEKAQAVGDRVPHQYYGDPRFRLITMVNFQQKIFPAFRGMISAVIRYRLDAEAKELQKVYAERQLKRNPREDVFVVADFDGKAVSLLGIAPTSSEFAVFVFDGHGRLVRRWSDVPSTEALAQAIKEAR